MLDVAVWDMACPMPSLALIGSIELKADPGRWKYPQLIGQLVGQAFLKYNLGEISGDGTVR